MRALVARLVGAGVASAAVAGCASPAGDPGAEAAAVEARVVGGSVAVHGAGAWAPGDETGIASALSVHRGAGGGARGWVVLLPGASGLRVFEDDGHYHRVAERLAAAGLDAIVVDYKRAYASAGGDRSDAAGVARPGAGSSTGAKIAWVTEQVAGWARETGVIDADAPGVVMAWSLGAEGVWLLLPGRAEALGIRAAVCWYPAHERASVLETPLPVLVLTGSADDVIAAAGIEAFVATARGGRVEFEVYEGAHHGFDIESISPARRVSLIPLIGPSATFGYDRAGATRAWVRTESFLARVLPIRAE